MDERQPPKWAILAFYDLFDFNAFFKPILDVLCKVLSGSAFHSGQEFSAIAPKDHQVLRFPNVIAGSEPQPLRATRLQRLVTETITARNDLKSHEGPRWGPPATLENQRIATNLVWVKFHVFSRCDVHAC
jgi:hypothetical protein